MIERRGARQEDARRLISTGTPLERSVDIAEAARRAEAAATNLGYVYDCRAQGASAFSSWRCILRDARGLEVPDGEGLGKGVDPESSRLGALCEALEHALSGPSQSETLRYELRSCEEIHAGPLATEGFASVLPDTTDSIACFEFGSLVDTTALSVPAGLVCPWYVEDGTEATRLRLGDNLSYTDMWRYSSNSGVALGVGRSEALLHALHELVERDSYSIFLMDACVRRLDVGALRIPDENLTAQSAQLVDGVASEIGARVEIYDITSDIGIPAVFAMARAGRSTNPVRGSGASLSFEHAVNRAVTELIQDFEYEVALGESRVNTYQAVERRKFPESIQRCQSLVFKADDPPSKARHRRRTEGVSCRVSTQLAETCERLSASGFHPFARDVAQLVEGISVVQAYVPGLERFMLVTAGHPLVPGARGRTSTLLNAAE